MIARNPLHQSARLKMSRRAVALAVATTISVAGMAMPAQAKDGPRGGGDSSSTSAPKAPSSDESTSPTTVRVRPSTTVKNDDEHESEEKEETTSTSQKAPKETTSTSAGSTATTARRNDDKAKSARESVKAIDKLIRRLQKSKVDPAVVDALVARLLDLKASFAAGQEASPAALQALTGEVRAALGAVEDRDDETEASTSSSSTAPDNDDDAEKEKEKDKKDKKEKGKHAHDRATEVLQAQIDKINASNLPDDLKAKIVAALTEAQQNVASHADASDAAKEIHDSLEKRRADKFAKMQARLGRAADRVQAAIDRAAALPGNEAIVADATAKLADAKAKVAAATTVAELKAAWSLMKDIRKSLPKVELEAPTTTVAEAPTTTVAPTPETSAAAPSDTSVPTNG
jgi:hypothetical protein